MKKIVFLILCIASISNNINATVHVVQVANYQFTPANVSDVAVGDTMRWVWVSGNHTTTDDPATQSGNSLPAGAATWSAPMDTLHPTFDYAVTVAGTYKYWCIPHAPGMAASFTASTALPVTLSSFAVSGSKGKAVISWRTMTEANTDYFSVRRSSNGSSYTEIAKVPAAGNSNAEKVYTFTDPVTNSNQYFYYNIAIVDKDGRQQFSATKMFKGDGDAAKKDIAFTCLVKGFLFRKELMQEHFNENYIESDKYPKASFTGNYTGDVNMSKDGTYPVQVKGQLTLHGVTKNIETPATLAVKGNTLTGASDFKITPADFDIKIPSLVREKIAKQMDVHVLAECNLK